MNCFELCNLQASWLYHRHTLLTDQMKYAEPCKLARRLTQNVQLSQADLKPLLVQAICCSLLYHRPSRPETAAGFWQLKVPLLCSIWLPLVSCLLCVHTAPSLALTSSIPLFARYNFSCTTRQLACIDRHVSAPSAGSVGPCPPWQ